ncbi:MAG: hypothetical protein ACJ8MH_07330, partial [Povalibacter sp.]
ETLTHVVSSYVTGFRPAGCGLWPPTEYASTSAHAVIANIISIEQANAGAISPELWHPSWFILQ